jgi:hypothetical protein
MQLYLRAQEKRPLRRRQILGLAMDEIHPEQHVINNRIKNLNIDDNFHIPDREFGIKLC